MKRKIFRAEDWWRSKAVLLMGMLYMFTAWLHISFRTFTRLSILSLITIGGFASMGYFINDFFDLKQDLKAGKKNFLAEKSKSILVLLFTISCTFILIPWKFLPADCFSYVLIFTQIILFILYSAPPIRVKEKGIAGIITDALYGHALPHILAAYTFYLVAQTPLNNFLFVILFSWQFTSGVRNILLHQKDDILFDKQSETKTFVLNMTDEGFLFSIKYLVILETILSGSFFLLLSATDISFLSCFFIICLISVWIAILFKGQGMLSFFKSKWKYFPNNLFEQWMPLVYLVILVFSNINFLLIFFIHLFIFNIDFYPKVLQKMYHWIEFFINKKIYSVPIKNIPSWFINNFIFVLFLVIGVNLKHGKTSAMGYLKKKFKNS